MRRGFTIIELLVVIGIFALLMGLTIGGIAAMRKTDKLLATEQLVGDVIRQARHTARTSGAPVTVSIRTEQGRGVISGISRVPIWSENFDGTPGGTGGNIAGLTGLGYRVELPAWDPESLPLDRTLSPQEKLVRGGNATGFYLSCHVRPPAASTSGILDIVPLLLVGEDATQANSRCGLLLRRATRLEQRLEQGDFEQDAANHPWPVAGDLLPQLATWEIIGWINDDNLPADNPIEVSSIHPDDCPADITRDEQPLHLSVPADEYDVAWPMAGGRWEEIGLLFDRDGRRLVLYRNGVRVGERALTGMPRLAIGTEKIRVGIIDLGSGKRYADTAALDEVAVYRLATAEPARLPGDIVPQQSYNVVAQPDGRVETNSAVALMFSGSFNQAGHAELTVTIDGHVSGKIVP